MTARKLGSARFGGAVRYLPWSVVVGLLSAAACGGSASKSGSMVAAAGSNLGGGGNPPPTGNGGMSNSTAGMPILDLPTGGESSNPATGPCTNLQCQQTTCKMGPCMQQACASGTSTTVSGTVFDPAGKVPLYNAVVWVPNEPVPALTSGASCDRCGASIHNPVASALTDNAGKFTMTDVPVGTDIPVVIQIGKWRRQIKVSTVAACADTPIDPSLTRLPKNKSEGDIPLIALATGGADSMECLPLRMGIDPAEFTTDAGDGRVHLYAGTDNGNNTRATRAFSPSLNAGAMLTPATTLWADTASLSRYDIVILSCEGATLDNAKPMTARQALYDYESLGGRVFASHWHRVWFSDGPAPVPTIGTWQDVMPDPQSPAVGTINTSFPKGLALSQWLVNVGASTTAGQLDIIAARDNLQAVNTAANMATEWITVQHTNNPRNVMTPNAVQYVSYNAPLAVEPAMQCGRAVFTDLHVSATGNDPTTGGDTTGRASPFPSGCNTMRDLTPQEKAVEFMLFDLSSCIQSDMEVPVPPVPR